MRKLLVGLGMVFLLAVLGFARADNNGEKEEEQCSPTTLSVGYVDNDVLDAHSGSFFPPPLVLNADGHTANCGANCVLVGTPGSNGQWDAGVLKIDNPSSTMPLVVQNVTVDIGPVTGINPWKVDPGFPLTIPPGGTLMLTEDENKFNFDTSDMPRSAGPPSCTNSGATPLIHVTVGTSVQVTRNFPDTTQVLNTGGIDTGRCPPTAPGNEGHAFVQLNEQHNDCECDPDENGDDNGQTGGQGNGNRN